MSCTDPSLESFLVAQIARFEELDALADAVIRVSKSDELGDSYRAYKERVRGEAENEVEGAIGSSGPWQRLIFRALASADAHLHAPLNSRRLSDIHFNVGDAMQTLSGCKFDLEQKLEQLRG